MEVLTPVIGVALGAIVLLQLALWTTIAIRRLYFDRQQFDLSQKLLRRQLEQPFDSESEDENLRWNGFRKFHIQNVQSEAKNCVSIDLVPEDGRRLPFHLPGQHIAVRLTVPGQSRPIIRCYSLSDAPSSERFRITVRALGPPRDLPNAPPGLASNYLSQHLTLGDRIDIKAPSGSFYLDLNDRRPVVCLAGGIGITPIMSMLNTMIQHKIKREVLLLYGVQNSEHHAFKSHLAKIAANCPHFNIVTCYSNPLATDKLGQDYQQAGRVSIDLIKKLVPSMHVPVYMCGPSGFMQTLFAALQEWGVPESLIHYEAFGPASVRQTRAAEKRLGGANATREYTVTFGKTGVTALWKSEAQSILDLAEQNDVSIPSGCRAGNCGTCQTRLLSGQVCYINDTAHAECDPGHVLACVARPTAQVVVEA
jgi:ferredoxin-NADP reductase